MKVIHAALERYHMRFGEYPEPTNPDETIEIMPGEVYRAGGAKCLYQALSGDGLDAIKQSRIKTPTHSDGKISAEEDQNIVFQDMPRFMWRKVGAHYFLVDAFGRPIQYLKADSENKNTINSTYDLWSFADDDKHVMSKSKDTEASRGLGAKWITNW